MPALLACEEASVAAGGLSLVEYVRAAGPVLEASLVVADLFLDP